MSKVSDQEGWEKSVAWYGNRETSVMETWAHCDHNLPKSLYFSFVKRWGYILGLFSKWSRHLCRPVGLGYLKYLYFLRKFQGNCPFWKLIWVEWGREIVLFSVVEWDLSVLCCLFLPLLAFKKLQVHREQSPWFIVLLGFFLVIQSGHI